MFNNVTHLAKPVPEADPTLPGAYENSPEARSLRLFDMDKLEIPEKHRPLFLSLNRAVRDYMYQDRYDPSHDYEHIQRVVMFTHKLYMEEKNLDRPSVLGILMQKLFGIKSRSMRVSPQIDITTMYIAAMMHDIGEPKYSEDGKTQEEAVIDMMLENGALLELANNVAAIAVNVSFTREFTAVDRTLIHAIIKAHPELAFVQDADRLDAIGSAGQGRTFAYGGANPIRRTQTLHMAVQLQHRRYRHYLDMMKTRSGRKTAEIKMARMVRFRKEWLEETDVSSVL